MSRLSAIILLYVLTGSSHIKSNEENPGAKKLVIGYLSAQHGMFSVLCRIPHVIAWCESNGKIPVVYWNQSCPYYHAGGFNGSTNVWEYYFEPVSGEKYVPGDEITCSLFVSGGHLMPPTHKEAQSWDHRDFRKKIKPYVDKYLKVKPEIQKKVDAFYEDHIKGRKTIALHLRGTDKATEIQPVALEDLCSIANEYAAKSPGCQFFVCTDELSLLTRAQELLHGEVIAYDAFRSRDGNPLHLDHSHEQSPAQLGEDVIIEVLLMARCDLLVHTWSNVSLGAMYFNATLDSVY